MPELTLEGRPVQGDIIGKYIAVQLSPSGRAWDIKIQRESFEYILNAIFALDLSRKTRVCHIRRGRIVDVARSWN